MILFLGIKELQGQRVSQVHRESLEKTGIMG
jgi:hypothetical protein